MSNTAVKLEQIYSQTDEVVSKFTRKFSKLAEINPLLALDESFPSLATIHFITFPLRLVTKLTPEQKELCYEASAYIGRVIEKCWNQIADEVILRCSDDSVTLTARGGRFLPTGTRAELDLFSLLTDVLRYLPDPFPITREFKRNISIDTNVISLAALGAALGIGPSVRSSWNDLVPEDFSPAIQTVQKELARQTADFYSRCFPDEPLGSVAEIYLTALVYPPLLCEEPIPAINASLQVLDFCSEYKINQKQLRKFAGNLAQFHDETLSATGLVLWCACCDELPSKKIISAAEAKSKFMGLIRRSVNLTREKLNKPADWIINGPTISDEVFFNRDQQLNTLPWLFLPFERLVEKEFWTLVKPLVSTMCSFDYEESLKIAEHLVENYPAETDIRLQYIKLFMVGGKYAEVEGLFRKLLSEPEVENNARFFHLWCLASIHLEDYKSAVKYGYQALSLMTSDDHIFSDLCNNLGWALLMQGELQSALENFDRGLQNCTSPITLLLNKAHVLWKLGRKDEAISIQSQLWEYASIDIRVFNSLPLQ